VPFAVLLAALAEVPDPRRAQGQRYSMRHLLLFSVLATLAGATSYQKIIAFIALQRERLNAVFGACFRRAPAPASGALRRSTRCATCSWRLAATISKQPSAAMPAT